MINLTVRKKYTIRLPFFNWLSTQILQYTKELTIKLTQPSNFYKHQDHILYQQQSMGIGDFDIDS